MSEIFEYKLNYNKLIFGWFHLMRFYNKKQYTYHKISIKQIMMMTIIIHTQHFESRVSLLCVKEETTFGIKVVEKRLKVPFCEPP